MNIRTLQSGMQKVDGAVGSGFRATIACCLLGSVLVGCATADKANDVSSEPEPSAVEEQDAASGSEPVAVEQPRVEPAADAATGTDSGAAADGAEADADAMMAKLAAPIQEPVSKALPEQKVSSVAEVKTKADSGAGAKAEAEARAKADAQARAEAEAKLKAAAAAQAEAQAKADAQARLEAEAKAKAAAAPVAKSISGGAPLNVGVRDLPVIYDVWIIAKGEAALDKEIVITTPTWEMGKTGFSSQVWLTIMDDKMLVSSSSVIDPETAGSGIKINGGKLIPYSRIEGRNVAVIDGNWLDQLVGGGKLDIYMGFFPDRKPRGETFQSDISLDSLSRVIPTYLKMTGR